MLKINKVILIWKICFSSAPPCIYLRTNRDLCHLQHKLVGFYNRDEKCLLRDANWVIELDSLRIVFKWLINNVHLFVIIPLLPFNLLVRVSAKNCLRTQSELASRPHHWSSLNSCPNDIHRKLQRMFLFTGVQEFSRRCYWLDMRLEDYSSLYSARCMKIQREKRNFYLFLT